MSLVIVETTTEQPITDEFLHESDQQVLPCLKERNATWRYSLLSVDRRRMICTFDAPDAESVRESYRRAGLPPRPIWAGGLIKPEGAQPQRNPALLKIIEGTYPPLSEEDWNEARSKTLPCYAERGIEWIQSYISLDRTKVICELNAPDLESVRQVQRRLNIPFNCVWSAQLLTP